MTFIERVQKRRDEGRAKLAAQKAYIEPGPPQPKYLAETTVEGKSVAAWASEVEMLEEMVDDERIALLRSNGVRNCVPVLDMVEHFPGLATDAVSRWKASGCPTEYDEVANKLARLRAEADKYTAFASIEDGKVKRYEENRDLKKMGQHRKYAQTSRDKAAAFLAEAEKLANEYQKEHLHV